MTTWVLSVCIGVTWAGCGAAFNGEFPDEQSCYRALREMRVSNQPIAESGRQRSTVAACLPMKERGK